MGKQQYGYGLTIMVLVVLVAAQAVESARELGVHLSKPWDPWYGQKLPPEPNPGYYKHLGECIDKLTEACGLQISDYIFNSTSISIPCCQNLKCMGQLCNKSLSLTLSQLDMFKSQAQHIIQMSDTAYDMCVKVAPKECN